MLRPCVYRGPSQQSQIDEHKRDIALQKEALERSTRELALMRSRHERLLKEIDEHETSHHNMGVSPMSPTRFQDSCHKCAELQRRLDEANKEIEELKNRIASLRRATEVRIRWCIGCRG